MKIVHIITSLDDGGAEHTLYKICKYDKYNKHVVISLKGTGKYFYLLNKIGVKVYCLNLKFYAIYQFLSFITLLKFLKPDVVQTWMYHADFFGGLAAKIVGIKNIFWNIRNSNLDKKTKFSTKLVLKINAILSNFIPNKIISCSKNSIKIHHALGYKNKFIYIGNGIKKKIINTIIIA